MAPRATALAVTDMLPAPQRLLKHLGWLDVTETEIYPDWGEVTCDESMV